MVNRGISINSEIKPCKLCGTNTSVINNHNNDYHVVCNKYSTIDNMCKRYVGLYDKSNSKKIILHITEQETIDYWNKNN